MSKSRFSSTDVQAMVGDIRGILLGQRIANIYDVNDKTYIFKFTLSEAATIHQTGAIEQEGSSKVLLLLESGVRFHVTSFYREKSEMPSPFAMKLRKHLRTKRLENVRQIGTDRIVDFKFGSGESECHIILELYSGGNIILTNQNYEILALLRSYKLDDSVDIQVGNVFSIPQQEADAVTATGNLLVPVFARSIPEFKAWIREKELEYLCKEAAALDSGTGGKKVKAKKFTVRQLLLSKDSGVASFGSEILEHCILASGLDANTKVETILSPEFSDSALENLLHEIGNGAALMTDLDRPLKPGYIVYKPFSQSDERLEEKDMEFLEFLPKLFKQHESKLSFEVSSFHEAVDRYFCKFEEQKLEKIAKAAEEAAQKKVDKVVGDFNKNLAALAAEQDYLERGAILIEMRASDVDKAILVISSALDSGMTWEDIAEMVSTETRAGNPIASLVSKLKLKDNRVVVKLPDYCEDDSDHSDSNEHQTLTKAKQAFVEVEIDLSLSAHANACKIHDDRKHARQKEAKTREASVRAIESVQEASLKALAKQNVQRGLRSVRRKHWFEKFNWFISSEGYLILSGSDAQQNELLVKRYLRPGDVYVHADIHGASSCIIRSKTKPLMGPDGSPMTTISPSCLQEAGTMTMCRSGAWSAKIVASAWWVHANQVSKTAPSGEYLSTGSFMIYGKKNFLPPQSLEMGFGIVFRLDDSSVTRHLNDRVDKRRFDDTESMFSQAIDRYGLDHDMGMLIHEGFPEDEEDDEIDKLISKLKPNVGSNDSVPKTDQLDELASASGIEGGLVNQPSRLDCSNSEAEDDGEESDNSSDDGDIGDGTQGNVAEGQSKSEKLTVFERKMLKKLKLKGTAEDIRLVKEKAAEKLASKPAVLVKASSHQSASGAESNVKPKAKKLNKKKLKKYADQDDEDRELAMIALGHIKLKDSTISTTSLQNSGPEKAEKASQKTNVLVNSEKVWNESMSILDSAVSSAITSLLVDGVIKSGELDAIELRALASFDCTVAVEIVDAFRQSVTSKRVGNKSGHLAGIIKQYTKKEISVLEKNSSAVDEVTGTDADGSTATQQDVSRRERKKLESLEIAKIMEEEGITEEIDGEAADELEKLTGCPVSEDGVLYAMPMCGPYSSMLNFKYRVKLTPGPMKKGKAAKQAIDLFTRSRECTVIEKGLIKQLTDPEMVAVMIGDVKLSMPGLQAIKREVKGQKKSKAASKKDNL